MRTNGTLLYSLSCINSRLVSVKLIYVYLVISLSVNLLPANTTNMKIDIFWPTEVQFFYSRGVMKIDLWKRRMCLLTCWLTLSKVQRRRFGKWWWTTTSWRARSTSCKRNWTSPSGMTERSSRLYVFLRSRVEVLLRSVVCLFEVSFVGLFKVWCISLSSDIREGKVDELQTE